MLKDLIHSKDGKEVRASFRFKTYLLKIPIYAKGKKMLFTVASRQIHCSFQSLKIKELAKM